MSSRLQRVGIAIPDLISAGIFLLAWAAPDLLGVVYVKQLMTVMAMEFVVMHSSEFYALIYDAAGDRITRELLLLAIAGFYFTGVGVLVFLWHEPSLLVAFVWLFGSSFLHLWAVPANREQETRRLFSLWIVSFLAYLICGVAALLLPLPSLGLTAQALGPLHLARGWEEFPAAVMAFGALYFTVQSYAKYALSAPGGALAQQ
jgi:hypothetical protein